MGLNFVTYQCEIRNNRESNHWLYKIKDHSKTTQCILKYTVTNDKSHEVNWENLNV